jgi:hypothetical protein
MPVLAWWASALGGGSEDNPIPIKRRTSQIFQTQVLRFVLFFLHCIKHCVSNKIAYNKNKQAVSLSIVISEEY